MTHTGLIILGLFSYFVCISCVRDPLNSFIRHHEKLSYDLPDVHRRARRALELSPFANVEIKFKAFNLNFTLHLRRNHDLFAPDFQIVDGKGNKIEYDYSRFYQGDVEGYPTQKSHVMGKVHDGRFEGSIHVGKDEFHIEPAERFFPEDILNTENFHSIMYRISDVEHAAKVAKPLTPKRPTSFKNSMQNHDEKDAVKKGKGRYRRGTKNRQMNTCNLKVVADHLFMRKFIRRQTAIDQMVLHYQAVEFIFRNQTFNTTNQFDSNFAPEGIGFRIKEVVVLNEETTPEKMKPDHISVHDLLEIFSRMNHSSVCLAYLFTDRSFDDGVLGLAWVGYPYGQAGGICDPYADYGGTMKSYNTGLISFKFFHREAPRSLTEITFAHQLGHSFGAQHDPDTKECRPGDAKGGNYIMYDKGTPGFLKNNKAFSQCSISSMIPVINAKGLEATTGCFKNRYWAICGNGAHEEGEICDCGTVETCVEKCCIPYGSKEGTACTLRNPAYGCSPSRGPCCYNDTCTVAREFIKCFDGTECQNPRYCTGLQVECPVEQPKANLTLCDRDRSVCINGFCQGSICLRYGYESCLCTQPEDKCKVCCMHEGTCKSSYDILEMPNGTMSRGMPCDMYRGYCDFRGTCVPIDMDGPMRLLYFTFFTEEGIKIWFSRYWFVLLLGSFLILCMLAAFVYYCQHFTPSDNPALQERKPHKQIRMNRVRMGTVYQTGGGQPIPMAQSYT